MVVVVQEASASETPEPATPAPAASGSSGLLNRPGSGTGMGGGAGAFANLMRLGSSFREAPSTGALTGFLADSLIPWKNSCDLMCVSMGISFDSRQLDSD